MMALRNLRPWGTDRMAYRVRIFLRRQDLSAGRHIGERWLREIPRRGGRVAFHGDDTVSAGKIERIVLDSWEPTSEFIPTLHVVQDAETRATKSPTGECGGG